MNPVTKKRMGKNKWIVHSDYHSAIFSLYEKLSKAKIWAGPCSGTGLHRDLYGYTETDDHGRTTKYGRISEIDGTELDYINQQDVQERIGEWIKRIEYLQEKDELVSWEKRNDGYYIDNNNDLCFECEKGKIHKVYGINNQVIYN